MDKQGRKTGGRKKGSLNKATVARVAELAGSGLTPLEYMLGVLRDENETPERRSWAADKAAPYVHPRLASVEQKGDLALTVKVEQF